MSTQSESPLGGAVEHLNGELPDEEYHRTPEHPASPQTRLQTAPDGMIVPYNCPMPYSENVARGEAILGGIVVASWVTFFALGILVPTRSMRDALWSGTSGGMGLAYGVLIATSYTLTNVFFLSCLAALLGCMAYRWQVGDTSTGFPPHARPAAATRIYLAALLRGFFLYLMFVSGFLIVATEKTVTDTEFGQYVRIAGVMSIVGFIVGYDPNILIRLMRRILNVTFGESPAQPQGRERETTLLDQDLREPNRRFSK